MLQIKPKNIHPDFCFESFDAFLSWYRSNWQVRLNRYLSSQRYTNELITLGGRPSISVTDCYAIHYFLKKLFLPLRGEHLFPFDKADGLEVIYLQTLGELRDRSPVTLTGPDSHVRTYQLFTESGSLVSTTPEDQFVESSLRLIPKDTVVRMVAEIDAKYRGYDIPSPETESSLKTLKVRVWVTKSNTTFQDITRLTELRF